MKNFLGVFIEPSGSLLAAIEDRKSLLESQMPDQPYTTAPPHCTLVHGRYKLVHKWTKLLARALEAVAPFSVSTSGWQEFPADPMTLGGHTVAFRADLDRNLASLQQIVAKTVAPYAVLPLEQHPLRSVEPFAKSLGKYGSAFVGPHWIPHFTIGSPRVAKGSKLLEDLTAGNSKHRFSVEYVSIWQAENDSHRKLFEIPLGA